MTFETLDLVGAQVAVFGAVVAVLSGCSLLVDDEPQGSSDAAVSVPGIDARPGTDAGTDADAGPSSGVDAGPGFLLGPGLLARYYLDEGSASDTLLDAASDPLNLPITKTDGLDYAGASGRVGLSWPAEGSDGLAATSVSGTKIAMLHGVKTATVELVASVQASGSEADPSALFHIGKDNFEGSLSVWVHSGTTVMLGFQDQYVASWSVPALASGPTVLHVVLDSAAALAVDRARLFANGSEVSADDVLDEFNGAIIFISGGAQIVVGNDTGGADSIQGNLSYAAVYASVFANQHITQNAGVLLGSDDSP